MSDRQNGTYYFNAATQQTVWEAPIEKADAATVKKDAEAKRLRDENRDAAKRAGRKK